MDLGRVISAATAVGKIELLNIFVHLGPGPGVWRDVLGSEVGKHAFRARKLMIVSTVVEYAHVEELVECVATYGTHAIVVCVANNKPESMAVIDAALAGALQGINWEAVAGRSPQLRLKVGLFRVEGWLPLTAAACDDTAGVVAMLD